MILKDVAGDACTFADIFRSPNGVKRDEIACAFANTFACGYGSLGGALANIAGFAANISAGLRFWGGGGVCACEAAGGF